MGTKTRVLTAVLCLVGILSFTYQTIITLESDTIHLMADDGVFIRMSGERSIQIITPVNISFVGCDPLIVESVQSGEQTTLDNPVPPRSGWNCPLMLTGDLTLSEGTWVLRTGEQFNLVRFEGENLYFNELTYSAKQVRVGLYFIATLALVSVIAIMGFYPKRRT